MPTAESRRSPGSGPEDAASKYRPKSYYESVLSCTESSGTVIQQHLDDAASPRVGVLPRVRVALGIRSAGRWRTDHRHRDRQSRSARARRDCVYTVPGLSPGDYRIDVELAGFRPIRREGVRVETGETVRLD